MSDRERWIVYPLLFYAMVMGMKSSCRDPMEFRCRTIECQQLKVQMINGSDARALPFSRNAANVIFVPAGNAPQGQASEEGDALDPAELTGEAHAVGNSAPRSGPETASPDPLSAPGEASE